MHASEKKIDLLTAIEAADIIGVTTRTLWSYTSPRGPIPAMKFGNRLRYTRKSIEAYIEQQLKVSLLNVEPDYNLANTLSESEATGLLSPQALKNVSRVLVNGEPRLSLSAVAEARAQ